MSEIKTCEQYVLSRLEQAEHDVESMKLDIVFKDDRIESLESDLNELISFIQRISRVTTNDDGNKYIGFDSLWELYEPEDFKYMSNILAMANNNKEGN